MDNTSSKDNCNTKRRSVMFNLILLFIIFFCNNVPYITMEVLQTSLNGNIGIYSITLVYLCRIFSCLFGPAIVRYVTPKCCIVIFGSTVTIYTLANIYPKWYILLPASVVVGVSHGFGFISCGMYCTNLALQYAIITKRAKLNVLTRFNAFFFSSIPLSILVGNWITSFVLSNLTFKSSTADDTEIMSKITFESNLTSTSQTNYTMEDTRIREYSSVSHCGPAYCSYMHNLHSNYTETTSAEDHRPEALVLLVLILILTTFGVISVLLTILFLQQLPVPSETLSPKDKTLSNLMKVKNYMKRFFRWKFMCLCPSVTYLSLFLINLVGMFPKAYITCILGVDMIGYITMVRGISAFVMGIVMAMIGYLLKRNIWFAIAYIMAAGTITLLLLWNFLPHDNDTLLLGIFFAVSTFGGIINTINFSQFAAFIGTSFAKEITEAFAFFSLTRSVVSAVGFYVNTSMCASTQLYVLLGLMLLAPMTYLPLDYYLTKHPPTLEA